MINSLLQDIRYGLRTLASRPMFTLVAVLTLALGIGANTAIFSVIHGMYLRPLPYPGGDRLVEVHNTYPKMGLENAGTSIPDYLDRRDHAPSLEDLTMYSGGSYNMADGGSPPEQITGLRATPSFFTRCRWPPPRPGFTVAQAVPGQDRVRDPHARGQPLNSDRRSRSRRTAHGETYCVIGVCRGMASEPHVPVGAVRVHSGTDARTSAATSSPVRRVA